MMIKESLQAETVSVAAGVVLVGLLVSSKCCSTNDRRDRRGTGGTCEQDILMSKTRSSEISKYEARRVVAETESPA